MTKEEIKEILNNHWKGFMKYDELSSIDLIHTKKQYSIEDLRFLAQDAFNLGLEIAAKNVKMKEKGSFVASTGYSKYKTRSVIDKQSILKLKIK